MIKTYDKTNKERFLYDLQARNDITVKDKTVIPDITCIINTVAKSKYRSKIDLIDGYYNIRIETESKKYMSFNTPFGTISTRVMQ